MVMNFIAVAGSADKTIKLWNTHKLITTFTGHRDAVRGLALIPELGFASCSNDGYVSLNFDFGSHFNTKGKARYEFGRLGETPSTRYRGTPPLYTVSQSCPVARLSLEAKIGLLGSGKVITHPAISVWTVDSMSNGDIVSGCSDGVVRVFSAREERWASASELKEYDDYVASQALPAQQVGDVKKSDLPGIEALSTPGKKPGEVKMVRNGDKVEAHQWDAGNYTWQKVGDVVDAVGQGRKQLYQGREYDYVFDVDIQDGVPPLKLPYNVTENPYSAAQKFLESNDLSLNYIDEVVKFIEKNTSGVNLGTGSDEYVDPFTGASRYRGSGGTSQPPSSAYMDPFTGASRYSGSSAQPPVPPASSYQDPFTGASRYSGAASSQPTSPPATPQSLSRLDTKSVLPMRQALTNKQANVDGMRSKVFHFDDVLRNEISTSVLAMYPEETSTIDDVFAYLAHVINNPSSSPPSPPTTASVETILQILDRWPRDQRFPVIDLSRLLAGQCPSAFDTPGTKTRFLETLCKAAEWNTPWAPPIPKVRQTNSYLMLRALANIVQDASVVDGAFLGELFVVLEQAPYEMLSLQQRQTLATILFNVSTVYLRTPFNATYRDQHVALVLRLLQKEKEDSETKYRALAALGNMLFAIKSNTGPAPTSAQSSEISQTLQSLPQGFKNEERVKVLLNQTATLL
ncbi:WD repeat protein Lub1 [Marasmius tenuissimus]|uniref:WD repeat protein Lub1 n=1 Tax=Marasmius tenuissimus TaxID=585030 RepID=A0ABR3A226_9AGAR